MSHMRARAAGPGTSRISGTGARRASCTDMSWHRKEGGLVGFEMNIVSGFKDCISRQIIEEIIRLRSKPQHLLMNPKWKFFGPVIKRKLHDEYKIRLVV